MSSPNLRTRPRAAIEEGLDGFQNHDERLQLITVSDFARLACLSRRQIDRLRASRPPGFPKEFELGSGRSKHRSCPRFKRCEVQKWLDSRALW
mgnify:CR=1 FL=1